MAATIVSERGLARTARVQPIRRPRLLATNRVVQFGALLAGAVVFLFPFYYMIVGALQREPKTDISGAFPQPGNLTLENLVSIHQSINLERTILNSGIFTGGVLICTLVFGMLAGYALGQLEFRGRQVIFYTMLLILIVPFQLLMIPLYVMIARDLNLADTYVGMILPFAINTTAVFIFRQFFTQIPKDLFEAARIDGASELAILTRIVVPITRPVILTAMLVTFIGPWNEFLWPFLITKRLELEPLAVALANYMSTVASRAANPFGSILAGATVLAVPVVILFVIFQRNFVQSELGSAVKG
jgi:multiple sugar transport system permease protein